MNKYLLVFLMVCGVLEASPGGVENISGPSFNCGKASTEIEKEICFGSNAEELKRLDLYMSDLYGFLIRNVEDPRSLRKSQQKWLQYRDINYLKSDVSSGEWNVCTGKKQLSICYSTRIAELYDVGENVNGFSDFIYERYWLVLDGFGKRPKNKIEKLLYRNQFEVDFLSEGDCVYQNESVVKYDPPSLVTLISGSAVCGGTSYAFKSLVLYCESDDGFTYEDAVQLNAWEHSEDEDYVTESKELDYSLCSGISNNQRNTDSGASVPSSVR